MACIEDASSFDAYSPIGFGFTRMGRLCARRRRYLWLGLRLPAVSFAQYLDNRLKWPYLMKVPPQAYPQHHRYLACGRCGGLKVVAAGKGDG